MRCPFCGELDTKVLATRVVEDGRALRRRRECEHCHQRFTTFERIEEFVPMVIKRDGRREAFSREKVINGLERACEKRPVSMDRIEAFVDTLFARIQEEFKREVKSIWIGEQVMEFLKTLDKVAYIRFASVYKIFQEPGDFQKELSSVMSDQPDA